MITIGLVQFGHFPKGISRLLSLPTCRRRLTLFLYNTIVFQWTRRLISSNIVCPAHELSSYEVIYGTFCPYQLLWPTSSKLFCKIYISASIITKKKYRARGQVEIFPAYIRGFPAKKPPETKPNMSKIFLPTHSISRQITPEKGHLGPSG